MYMNVHLFLKNVKYYYYVDPSPVKVHLLKHTVCDISQTLMHDKLFKYSSWHIKSSCQSLTWKQQKQELRTRETQVNYLLLNIYK